LLSPKILAENFCGEANTNYGDYKHAMEINSGGRFARLALAGELVRKYFDIFPISIS
jgi:hypothetical protein